MPRSYRCNSNCVQVPKSCHRRQRQQSTSLCMEYHYRYYSPFVIVLSCIILISIVHNNNLVIIVSAASSYNTKNNNNNNNNNNINNSMNPYNVLGVSNNANDKEIKSKYRELCLKYHPDKYNGLSSKEKIQYETKFKIIQDAYSKIGTINSRKQYDTMSYYTNTNTASNTRSSTSSSNRNDNTKNKNNNNNNNNNNPFNDYSSTSYDEMLRRMFAEQQQRQQQQQYQQQQQQQQQQHQTQSSFFNSGMNTNTNSPFASSVANGLSVLSSLKCIYKQRVPITLEELYNGQRHYDIMSNLKSRQQHQQQKRSQANNSINININNNIQYVMSGLVNNFIVNVWKRYTAAFRGGVAYIYLYQAFIYSIPLLRISKVVSLLFALYLFDRSIPIMNLFDTTNDIVHDDYYANILPGYKGGTKFTYHDSTNSRIDNGHYGLNTGNPISGSTAVLDIVFELYELQHKIYTRIGNNLHTTITISTKDAYNGCIKQLSSLNYNSIRNDEMITIIIPPNSISGSQIILKGYGWPIRSKTTKNTATKTTTGSNVPTKYGDLIVTISVPQSFDWKRLLNKLKRQSYH